MTTDNKNNKFKCPLCFEEILDIRKARRHCREKHGYEPQAFFDAFMKAPDDGQCKCCGVITGFVNLKEGYKKTCSHNCGAKLFRAKLKADPERFKKFQDKVAANQERIWEDREGDGTKQSMMDAVGATCAANNAKLTKEERQERFGWMNKLSEEDKKAKVKEILDKSLRAWEANTSEAEKQKMYDARREKMVELGHFTSREDKDAFELYGQMVRMVTERTYTKHKKIINPDNLPRGRGSNKYHVDHIVSIWDCFHSGISVEIASSVHNLRMLLGHDNLSKWKESHKPVEQLLQEYENGKNKL